MDLQSAEISEFAKAFSKAQYEMGPAIKGKTNPFFKSKYADLSACIEALREPFFNNGLSFIQATVPCESDSHMDIVTTILHESGQWMRGVYRTVLGGKKGLDPQSIGKAITYAKRYALCAITGLATEDDDGNSASGRGDNRQQNQRRQLPPKQTARTVNITAEQRGRLDAMYIKANAISPDAKRDMAAAYQLDLTAPVDAIEAVLRKIESEYKETS